MAGREGCEETQEAGGGREGGSGDGTTERTVCCANLKV